MGENGLDTLFMLKYNNAIFAYAIKASQELSQIVNQQQRQVDELKASDNSKLCIQKF